MSYEYLFTEIITWGDAAFRAFGTAFGLYLIVFGCVNLVRAIRDQPLWGDLDAVIHTAEQIRPFTSFVFKAMPASYAAWKREQGLA